MSVDIDVDAMLAEDDATEAPVVDMAVTDGADDAPDSEAVTAEATEDAPEAEAAPVAATEAAPVVEPTPFTVQVERGQPAYTLPGTTFNATTRTLTFADDRALENVARLVGKGRHFETKRADEVGAMRREIARLQQVQNEPDAEKETAKVFMQEYQRLMEMGEEDLAAFLREARQQWPVIQGKAERAYAERVLQQARTMNAPPEMDIDTVVEHAQTEVAQFVQDVLAHEPWATPEVRNELTELMQDEQMLNQFVLKVSRDMPDKGLRAGQWASDWDKANKLLAHIAKPYQRTAKVAETATARVQNTQSVADANAKALARAKPTTPPKPAPTKPKDAQRPQDVVRDAMAVWNDMRRAG